MKNPFYVLGINLGALPYISDEKLIEIAKTRYRELALIYHPDRIADSFLKKKFEEKFKEISSVYSLLQERGAVAKYKKEYFEKKSKRIENLEKKVEDTLKESENIKTSFLNYIQKKICGDRSAEFIIYDINERRGYSLINNERKGLFPSLDKKEKILYTLEEKRKEIIEKKVKANETIKKLKEKIGGGCKKKNRELSTEMIKNLGDEIGKNFEIYKKSIKKIKRINKEIKKREEPLKSKRGEIRKREEERRKTKIMKMLFRKIKISNGKIYEIKKGRYFDSGEVMMGTVKFSSLDNVKRIIPYNINYLTGKSTKFGPGEIYEEKFKNFLEKITPEIIEGNYLLTAKEDEGKMRYYMKGIIKKVLK